MQITKITVQMLDGSTLEASTRTYMCTADRVAFERQFDTSSGQLMNLGQHFGPDGELLEGADMSVLREEWIAFFTWRALGRELPETTRTASFEEFLEKVLNIDLAQESEEEDAQDPTVPAPQPG
ncbi:MAG: hypothetical protein ACRDHM_07425 [Actinomycetota bacterium]